MVSLSRATIDANLGSYLASSSEFPTTETELIAIAAAAKKGSQVYISAPKIGTSAPDATGMRPVL
jgi:hypothetical protein